MIDIDAKGTWNVSRAAYRARLKDHGGQILNISATLHYGGTPGQVHVAAAKAAVDAMTRTLAVEWGPQGIRVNAIAPGPIGDTEGARRLFPGEQADRLRSMIPTRRLGSIDDIVNLALFVLSDAGSNINGAILVSDGGLCHTGRFGLELDAGGQCVIRSPADSPGDGTDLASQPVRRNVDFAGATLRDRHREAQYTGPGAGQGDVQPCGAAIELSNEPWRWRR